MSDRYIAAVEISSSKIIATVGKLAGSGRIDVIAVEQETGVDVVRYGIIQNLEDTSVRISRLISRLENHPEISPMKIKGVFVGLSGRSLKSIPTEVVRNLPDDTEISEEIIENLKSDAMRTPIDNSLEMVDAVPRIYKVGSISSHSPKGMVGSKIEATFDLIVSRPELKRNIMRSISEKLGIKIEGFVITALASGNLILSPDEKRLGCMLVDMGAETTSVVIYRDGCLRYFATLPLGGRNITRDITSLSILEEKAEDIKLQSGKAIVGDTASSLNLNGLKLSDVNNLVVARSEEIVSNIVEQIEYAGLDESKLPGGIVCIGGGSRLSEMMELLHQQSNLAVRRGELPKDVIVSDAKAAKTEFVEVAGIMYAGSAFSNAVCLEIPEKEDMPKNGSMLNDEDDESDIDPRLNGNGRGSRFFVRIKDSIKTGVAHIFSSPTDDDSDIIE